MAVFDSATVPGSKVVLTALRDADGKPVIVSLAPNQRENMPVQEIRVNVLTSAYGKDNAQRWINDQVAAGRLNYLNKEIPALSGPSRLQLPAGVPKASGASARNVRSQEDLRKYRALLRSKLSAAEGGAPVAPAVRSALIAGDHGEVIGRLIDAGSLDVVSMGSGAG